MVRWAGDHHFHKRSTCLLRRRHLNSASRFQRRPMVHSLARSTDVSCPATTRDIGRRTRQCRPGNFFSWKRRPGGSWSWTSSLPVVSLDSSTGGFSAHELCGPRPPCVPLVKIVTIRRFFSWCELGNLVDLVAVVGHRLGTVRPEVRSAT